MARSYIRIESESGVESKSDFSGSGQSRSCMPMASKVAGSTVMAGVAGRVATTVVEFSGGTSISTSARRMISRKMGAAALLP